MTESARDIGMAWRGGQYRFNADQGFASAGTKALSEDEIETLRALGYLGDGD